MKEYGNVITPEEYAEVDAACKCGEIVPMYAKMVKDGQVMYGSLMEGFFELKAAGWTPDMEVYEDNED